MKIVSQLDANGVYIGPVEADESPLERGVYLIPGGAVDASPPTPPAGSIARWNGLSFDVEVLPVVTEPTPLPAPSVVSMRQARLALLARGLLGAVDSAITSIPDNAQRQAAAIEWEYATEVRRTSPLVGLLVLALGLDEVAVDQLFTEAGAL